MNDSTSFPLTEVNLNTHTSTAINEAKTNGHTHHHELTGQNGSLGGPVHRRHSRARAGQSMDVLVGMDIVDALEINVRGNTMGKEKQRPIVPPNPRGDPKVRQRWNNRIDFMVATIGYAVGLANVWRFPYLCYQYGGGTFLIPYLLSVVFLGAPMVVLELTIGQLLQLGATELFWHIHPRLKGIGLGALMTSVLVCCYYSIIMAWSLVFLSHSFQDPVPWKDKSNYFYDNIIHRSPDIGSLEGIELEVVLGLFIMWIIIYLTTMKGVTLQGKFSLITVVFPFIVLIFLFIKCLTLEGADEGIRYFIMPNWEKLWHVDIWVTAATQCFFSLSPCFGILVAFGSYLDYDKPTIVDGILITAINSFTSLFAGFVVFATLGYMANREGRPIDDVVENGPALAFIVYPEAISLMPGAPFWAVMFFLMLITLAIDSVFGYVEIINEWLLEFKQLQKWPRELLSLATCTGMFLAGIFFCTHAGIYWVELLDHFVPTFSLLALALAELGAVTYVYKFSRFQPELYEATGQYLSLFYKVCWKYIDPIVLMVLIAIIFIWEIKEPFQGLPTWSLGIAWTLSFCPILLVLYFAVFPSPPLEPRLPPANLKKKTSTDSNSPQPSPKSPHVDGDIATTNEIPPLNRAPGTAAVDNTAGENAVAEDIQTRDRQTKFGKQMASESTDDLGLMSVSDFTGRHHTASPTASNQSSSVEGAGEEGVDQHSATQLTGTKEKHKAKQTHKSWLKGKLFGKSDEQYKRFLDEDGEDTKSRNSISTAPDVTAERV